MSETPDRRIFIGDVHGHYDGLMQLFEAIAPSSQDQIYFVGDLIDRGPKSAQVVEFVQHNAYACVRGNHEQLLIDSFPNGQLHQPALQAWLYSGGQYTLSSYKSIHQLQEHLHWIVELPLYLDLGDIWLVHAGVHPRLPVEEQAEHELCWIRDEFHSITEPYFADKLIITGHTITFTLPQVSPGTVAQGCGWLDIDTGAYHRKSGWLTAFDFENALVYQVNVFNQEQRKLSLAQAVTQIQPALIRTHQAV